MMAMKEMITDMESEEQGQSMNQQKQEKQKESEEENEENNRRVVSPSQVSARAPCFDGVDSSPSKQNQTLNAC